MWLASHALQLHAHAISAYTRPITWTLVVHLFAAVALASPPIGSALCRMLHVGTAININIAIEHFRDERFTISYR